MKNLEKIVESKSFKTVIVITVVIAVLAFIFQAGVFVGFHKASFLFKSGDNFYRVYGERGPGSMMSGRNDEFSGGHGVIGKIVKVNLPTLVVLGPDNIEKVIVTDASTTVRVARDSSDLDKLVLDQFITVLGSPNDQGQIVAKFIRIIPAPNR